MKHLVLQKAEGRKAWWLLAFLFAFLSLPAPQADAGAATVYVVSYSPRYSWQVKNKRPIQIRFNKPMVAQAFVGKVATSIPVQITPALRTAPSGLTGKPS